MTSMNLRDQTRRHFFSRCSIGLGSIAFGAFLGEQGLARPVLSVTQPLEPTKTAIPRNTEIKLLELQ